MCFRGALMISKSGADRLCAPLPAFRGYLSIYMTLYVSRRLDFQTSVSPVLRTRCMEPSPSVFVLVENCCVSSVFYYVNRVSEFRVYHHACVEGVSNLASLPSAALAGADFGGSVVIDNVRSATWKVVDQCRLAWA